MLPLTPARTWRSPTLSGRLTCAAPPTPTPVKLPFSSNEGMENTYVVLHGHPYIGRRSRSLKADEPVQAYLYAEGQVTDQETARVATG